MILGGGEDEEEKGGEQREHYIWSSSSVNSTVISDQQALKGMLDIWCRETKERLCSAENLSYSWNKWDEAGKMQEYPRVGDGSGRKTEMRVKFVVPGISWSRSPRTGLTSPRSSIKPDITRISKDLVPPTVLGVSLASGTSWYHSGVLHWSQLPSVPSPPTLFQVGEPAPACWSGAWSPSGSELYDRRTRSVYSVQMFLYTVSAALFCLSVDFTATSDIKLRHPGLSQEPLCTRLQLVFLLLLPFNCSLEPVEVHARTTI